MHQDLRRLKGFGDAKLFPAYKIGVGITLAYVSYTQRGFPDSYHTNITRKYNSKDFQ